MALPENEVCEGLKAQPVTQHLITLRDDMKNTVRAFFPKKVITTVDFHDGDWDEDAIERYRKCAPAIILVAQGGKSKRRGGVINELHVFDAFIFTKGKSDRQRTVAALLIYEHLLKLLHDTDWCTDECVKNPESVQAKNMYGKGLDEMGIALWVVRWEQLVQIPYVTAKDVEECLNDFARLYVTNLNARPTEDPADTAASEQQIDLEVV